MFYIDPQVQRYFDSREYEVRGAFNTKAQKRDGKHTDFYYVDLKSEEYIILDGEYGFHIPFGFKVFRCTTERVVVSSDMSYLVAINESKKLVKFFEDGKFGKDYQMEYLNIKEDCHAH